MQKDQGVSMIFRKAGGILPAEGFLTARGYEMVGSHLQGLTASMEDYLEMIYRLGRGKSIRTGSLAEALSVNKSSVTKMARKLSSRGLVEYEPYGEIMLSSKGLPLGEYFFERHETLKEFLGLLGVRGNVLQEVEGLEHNLSQDTLKCVKELSAFAKNSPEWWAEFVSFRDASPL